MNIRIGGSIWACAPAAVVALPLLASQASANLVPLDFDADAGALTGCSDFGGAVVGTCGSFTADFVDLNMTVIVDQLVTGAFDGVDDSFTLFGASDPDSASFQLLAGGDPSIPAGRLADWKVYLVLEASGDVAPAPDGETMTLNSLTADLFLDPQFDTDRTVTTDLAPDFGDPDLQLVDNDGFFGLTGSATTDVGAAASAAFVFDDTADDVLIASATALLSGTVDIGSTFTSGMFEIAFDVDTDILGTDVLTFPFGINPIALLTGDINRATLQGFGAGTFIDGRFTGSQLEFQQRQVPGPATLGLFGTGLVALMGFAHRRRRRAN